MINRTHEPTATTPKNWIYPVPKARHSANDSTHDAVESFDVDTNEHGFVTRFQNGQPDDHWLLSLNVKHIENGDRIWLYYGSTAFDMGVVGVGTVTSVIESVIGHYDIKITWNSDATAKLIRRYSSTDEVREYMPWTHTLRSIDIYPNLVSALETAAGLNAPLSQDS